MGIIYESHTELPLSKGLSKLDLNCCKVRELSLDLNTHLIQFATKPKMQVGN